MDTFSFSRLTTYEDCPRRFYYQYIEKLEQKESVPLLLGKAIHAAVECKLAGDSFESALVQGMASVDFNSSVPYQDMTFMLGNVPETIKGETEVYFKIPLDQKETIFLQGFIDVVNGVEIVDWKSNRRMFGINDTTQMALYAFALHTLYGYEEIKARMFFLRFRKESTFIYDQQMMAYAKAWALDLALEIREQIERLDFEYYEHVFLPQLSSKCSYCPFSVECYQSRCNTVIVSA